MHPRYRSHGRAPLDSLALWDVQIRQSQPPEVEQSTIHMIAAHVDTTGGAIAGRLPSTYSRDGQERLIFQIDVKNTITKSASHGAPPVSSIPFSATSTTGAIVTVVMALGERP